MAGDFGALHVFVHVLDQHDGAVDHGTDSNGDTAKRHDIGVETLQVHHDECRKYAHRQADDRHEGGAHVEQESHTHQRHQHQFLAQLLPQVVHRALNECGAVVNGDDLHPLGQARAQLVEPGFHQVDGALGVFAKAHDNDAAHRFALAVELGDTTTHLRPQPDLGDVLEQQRCAVAIYPQGNGLEVGHALQVTTDTHHVFRLRHLHHRCANFLVAAGDGVLDMTQRNVERAQFVRVHCHLVLPDHASHRRHFRNSGHTLQFIFQEPVLQAAQLADVVPARAVLQGVDIHPAHPGGVRTQLWPGGLRQ